MATRRSSSWGPAPNPFWSERVVQELEIRNSRPVDLPVPSGDEEELMDQAIQGEQSVPVNGPTSRESSKGKGGSTEKQLAGRGERFSTPASWEDTRGGPSEQVGMKTEGEMPEDFGNGSLPDDGLQRALEQEMVEKLHQENLRLKSEMEQLRRSQILLGSGETTSSWSEVTENGIPPPPPRSRSPTRRCLRTQEERFTPQGTRVPDTAPPEGEGSLPAIPPWPWGENGYERSDVSGPCLRSWGPSLSGGVRYISGGQGHREVHNGELRRRGVARGEVQGGVNVRHGEPDEVMNAATARAEWLRQELMTLQLQMERETKYSGSKLVSDYWKQPVSRQEQQLGRASRWGVCQQAPLGRAGLGGDSGRAPQSRADFDGIGSDRVWQACEPGDSRACMGSAGQVGGPQGDRAWQAWASGDGRASMDELLRDGGQPSDRAGNSGVHEGDQHGRCEVQGKEFEGDGLKSTTIVLPQLSVAGKEAGLQCGDWIAQLRPLMGDLATTSLGWWDSMVKEVVAKYTTWLAASPLERLHSAQPDETIYNTTAARQRMDLRASGLLLAALPASLKQDLIASRNLTSGKILFKVFQTYQPGGASERATTLRELSMEQAVATPKEAVERLRTWRRHQQRAEELRVTLPDSTLLVKSLSTLVATVLASAPQASFRINTYRMTSRIDINPNAAVLQEYYNLLLAEMETLVLTPEANQDSGGARPAVSAVTTTPGAGQPGGKGNKVNVCHNWGSTQGCRYGRSCRFDHPTLPDQRERCWNCSSTQHRKTECTAKGGLLYQPGGVDGKDGIGKDGSGKGKKGGNGKSSSYKAGEGRGQTGGNQHQGQLPNGGSRADGRGGALRHDGQETQNDKETIGDKDKGKGSAQGGDDPKPEEQGVKSAPQGSTGETGSTQALMSEVTSLLRTMRMESSSNPQMRVMHLKRIEAGDTKSVLLDGGATHCLRPAKSREEWDTAMECEVSLASGKVWMRMNKTTGTLLTLDRRTQRIIPIRELVRLGIRVVWEENAIKMSRADGSHLPVWLDSGCPVVDEATGNRLMDEVEANNCYTAGIMKICVNVNDEESAALCGEEAVTNAKVLHSVFPEVPPRLLARVPGAVELDMGKVPINRRMRKKLRETGTRILHLFAGEKTRMWTQMNSESLIIVCIELEKGLNLHDSQLFGFIELYAREGLWDVVVGGPPCRTISLSRHRGDQGPRPLRSRNGDGRWGLGWNSTSQQEKVDGDSVLFLKMLWICYLSKVGNPKCEVMIEQPADPESYLSSDVERPYHGYPSFLAWKETRDIVNMLNLDRVDIDQGAFGHERVKPTTLLSDIPEIKALHGTRCTMRTSNWPNTLEERLEAAKRAAAWADGLVQVLQQSFLRKQNQAVFGPRAGQLRQNPQAWERFLQSRDRIRERLGLHPLPDERLALRALDAKQLEEWRQHIANEHVPSRRDCSHCLRNMGRDRPHTRSKHPEAFCLNIDVAGPFLPGHDQLETAPRYFMVGVFTVPLKDGCPLVQKLQELGGFVEQPGDLQAELRREQELLQQLSVHRGEQREGLEHIPEDRGTEEIPELVEDPEVPDEPLPEAVVKELDVQNQQWQEAIMDWTDVKVQNLTMAFPLKSRHVGDVANVLSAMYCKLRSLGMPLHRVHTDRAREFTGRQLAQWFRQRDVVHTTSAGDESQGCARVEAEIGYLKSRTRLLLGSAKVDTSLWPLALRHAGEQRFRSQMALLGIKLPQLVPFGTQAMARIKRWQHVREKDKWEHPMQQITVFGPAHSMSPTSHGYYICCQGRWMRSTVVVRYANPLPEAPPGGAVCGELAGEQVEERAHEDHQEDELPMFDVAETSEGKASLDLFDVQEVPAGSRPVPRRLHGKQTVPGLHAFRPGGEWAWDPLQLQSSNGEGAHGDRALHEGAHGDRALHDGRAHGDRALHEGAHGDRALHDGRAHGDRALYGEGAHGDRALHEGAHGEWAQQKEEAENWKKVWRSMVTTVEDGFKAAALELLQLKELRGLEQEERALLDDEIGVHVPGQLRKECERIEIKLRALQSVEEELQDLHQVTLVTRSIPLEEVRRNINEWKPALEAEYRSLIDHKAICPIDEEEYQRLRKQCDVVESIPGMLVSTLKPPSRKKARVVACGNHVQSGAERGDLSAGGIDTIAFRSLVSMATREGFSLGTADVKTAFLQAYRRSTPGRETIVQPPAILKEAGVLYYGWAERWKVTGALYGLVESPRDWADFRDGRLRQMSWRLHDGGRVQLRPTAESHLWKLVELSEDEGEEEKNVRAYLGVYVDDLVVAAKDDILVNFMEQLKKVFLMSPYEVVTDKQPVSFCGYEIIKKGGGYVLNQTKYTGDLLRRRSVQGYELQPLPKIEEGDDEPEKDIAVIREVQAVVGELQWLASRTRPDLAYATSLVARMVHRRPCYALRLCNYILKYLHRVPSFGLHYLPDDDVGTLHVKADTSFGPAHEQFRSVQGVAVYHGSHLLLWSSSRQPFVTLSTAEGELVGYSEAFQCGMSLSELLLLFNYPTKKILEGDSKAALCQITSDAGSWRTRHLRLRAWKLREMVMGGDSQWLAQHVPGGELVADGLTKPLQGAAHRKFLGLLGLDEGQR